MCEDNIEIGVTEITNNILVSATPTDQIIDINVTEQNEDVTLNITPSVVEVNIDVTQHLVTEQVTVDANTCVNIIDVSVTDATENVTLNITPSIVEVNINRGGGSGSGVWGSITGTLSDQTDLQAALNAKQNALGYTPVPTTRTLTINGVTYDLSANRSWTIAGGLSGSGTTNYLSKWTGASALGNSLVYDDGTNVMIGTNASLYKLTVNTASGVNFGVGRTSLFGTNDAVFLNSVDDTYSSIPFTLNASHIGLYIGYSEKLRINALGRVLIGTTTDNGTDLLQVNGSLVASSIKKSGGTSSQFLMADGSVSTLGSYVPTSRNLTINGTTYDLSADRTWSINGVLPTGGTSGQILSKVDGTDYNTTWIDNFASQLKHEVKLGATLAKGTPVYVSSANGTNMIVSAASNNAEVTSSKTLGLLESGGVTNDFVKVVTEGLLSGLNTSAATIGDPVWLGVSGGLLYGIANKPSAPAHMVSIGIVTRVHSVNGEIFIKVQNGFELEELHNVAISSPSNGQALIYDSSASLWRNQALTTYVGGSGTTNYLPKWSSNSALTNSLLFDNGTNVGLNTITPDTLLQVYYNSLTSTYNDIAHIGSGAGNSLFLGTSGYGFSLNAAANGADWGIRTDWDSGYMNFHFGASEKMRIASNGNVGIGLTYPAYKLDVVGDINITGSYRVNGVVIGAGTGTVTSVSATVPTGFAISGSPITSSGTLAITFATGYSLPTNASQTNWDTAYSNRITSASSPLSISANAISIAQATTSTSGYLSSTDWNTFNNKQAALTNPVTGTGTSGYLAKWSGTSAINGSLIYDNGSHIGIGTTAPDTYSQFGTGGGFTLQTSVTNGSSNINVVGNGSGFGGINFGNGTIRRAGIYGLDGSILGFYTNSTNSGAGLSESMRITSAGRIGIGTTNPSDRLNVVVGTNGNNSRFDGPTSGFILQTNASTVDLISYGGITPSYRPMNFSANANTNLTISTDGNLGLNSITPDFISSGDRVFTIQGIGTRSTINLQNSSTGTGGVAGSFRSYNGSTFLTTIDMIADGATNKGAFVFYTNNGGSISEKMRISSVGKVGIGTSNPTEKFNVYTNEIIWCTNLQHGYSTQFFVNFMNPSGGQVGSIMGNGTMTSYNVTSDYRLKEDLKPINGLDKVNKINIYDFKWKNSDSRMDGVLAHELQEILPYAVTGIKDGETNQQVDYSKIVPVLVQAIKELNAKIEAK